VNNQPTGARLLLQHPCGWLASIYNDEDRVSLDMRSIFVSLSRGELHSFSALLSDAVYRLTDEPDVDGLLMHERDARFVWRNATLNTFTIAYDRALFRLSGADFYALSMFVIQVAGALAEADMQRDPTMRLHNDPGHSFAAN
jgi:hypothetical protein